MSAEPLPVPTDAELDTRDRGVVDVHGRWVEPRVTPDTLRRVDAAIARLEKRRTQGGALCSG